MTNTLVCNRAVLQKTITILQQGGRRGEERAVLWLANAAQQTPASVIEVYEPDQIAEVDYFRLPPDTMRSLMAHLKSTRRRIIAQVHTHPEEAFHSDVDAEWAIIRHIGALSLVLPRFAATTSSESFCEEVMTYEFSANGTWDQCPSKGPHARIMVSG